MPELKEEGPRIHKEEAASRGGRFARVVGGLAALGEVGRVLPVLHRNFRAQWSLSCYHVMTCDGLVS